MRSCCQLALVVASIFCVGCQPPPQTKVTYQAIPARADFPDAAAEGVLKLACSANESALRSHFESRGLAFDSTLVRRESGRACHVYYEPTVPGFRASPDDHPVRKAYVSIDSLALLAGRKERFGDSLDAARLILHKLDKPIDISFSLSSDQPVSKLREAIGRDFPPARYRINTHGSSSEQFAPWMQDILKPGAAYGKPRVLVTRRLYEGSPELGNQTLSAITAFQRGPFSQSKLSWEGGDLQFAQHPLESGKIVLFYGESAKRYWGQDLSDPEYAYVLQTEFGADQAIPVIEPNHHVDYLQAFIPSARTALVAEPLCGDEKAARSLLAVLEDSYTPDPPELTNLATMVRGFRKKEWSLVRVQQTLSDARASHSRWPANNPAQMAAITAFAREHCPADPRQCIMGPSLQMLLDNHRDLFNTWITEATRRRSLEMLPARLIDAIENLVTGCDSGQQERARRRAATLAQLGFHVIRVPWLTGGDDWAGISYANSALIGNTLFVPEFGLSTEAAWFDALRSELPASIHVTPVPSRFLLLMNGGVHCLMAYGREPAATGE